MSEPKFIVDLNAGRLVKWLRIMGYDTAFVPGIEDGRLVSLAHEEGRILLTRDRNIMRRRLIVSGKLRAILLESERVEEQLRQVVDDCKLDTQRDFSLCIERNSPLVRTAREEIRDQASPYVFQTQDIIVECPSCRKPFWRGTHWRNIRRRLARWDAL